jgi:hypothetical protein
MDSAELATLQAKLQEIEANMASLTAQVHIYPHHRSIPACPVIHTFSMDFCDAAGNVSSRNG